MHKRAVWEVSRRVLHGRWRHKSGTQPPVSPEEIKAWRERFGLSQTKAARLLPTEPRTWQRWEAGENEPPEYLLRALRDLEREIAEDWHG